MEKEHNFRLNIAIPNGIILTLIGILVLVTPLFTELTQLNLLIDILAGAVLTAGGGVSLLFGVRTARKD